MRQPDAQRAAAGFEAEVLHQFEGIIVAVPGADAAIGERLGELLWCRAIDGERDGGHAPGDIGRARQAIDFDLRHEREGCQQILRKGALIGEDGPHRDLEHARSPAVAAGDIW